MIRYTPYYYYNFKRLFSGKYKPDTVTKVKEAFEFYLNFPDSVIFYESSYHLNEVKDNLESLGIAYKEYPAPSKPHCKVFVISDKDMTLFQLVNEKVDLFTDIHSKECDLVFVYEHYVRRTSELNITVDVV